MTTMYFSEKSEEIGEWHQDSLHGSLLTGTATGGR